MPTGYGQYAQDVTRPGAQIFAGLGTTENRVTHASIASGITKHDAVHGMDSGGHWAEIHDLMADLHGAWAIAFERENPGELARQARDSRWAALGLTAIVQWGAPPVQGPVLEHPTDPLNPMSDLVPACGWDCVAVHPHGPDGAVDAWAGNGAAA